MRTFVVLLGCLGVMLGADASVLSTAAHAQSPEAGAAPAAGVEPAPGAKGAGKPKLQTRRAVKQGDDRDDSPENATRDATALTVVPADPDPEVMQFAGTCGASAALSLDRGRVIVGSDDDNFLRTYDLVEPADLKVPGKPGESRLQQPRSQQNLYEFLDVNIRSRRNFSAIEGATLGDGITYWIGSHARRDDGETRANWRRLFAMGIEQRAGLSLLVPQGKPIHNLAQQLDADPIMKKTGLRNSIMVVYRKLEHLAPEQRGIDIQGLAMAPDGKTLWLALRNPTRRNLSTLIPIENPREAVMGAPAVFGEPIEIALDGWGISAIERVPQRGEYLIVSGEKGKSGGYRLHRWSGDKMSRPTDGVPLPADLNVQSFAVSEDGKRLLLLSDDSDLMIPVESKEICRRKYEDGACPCRLTQGSGAKRFRARWISLDEPQG